MADDARARPGPVPEQARVRRHRVSLDDYDPSHVPVAQSLCESYTVVYGVHAPNGPELMEKIVAAFTKVWGHLDEAMAHADDEVFPGADGKLLGTG